MERNPIPMPACPSLIAYDTWESAGTLLVCGCGRCPPPPAKPSWQDPTSFDYDPLRVLREGKA